MVVGRNFPGGFGPVLDDTALLAETDTGFVANGGLDREFTMRALRGQIYTSANTGAAYTATRNTFNQHFVLTVNANTTITLAGGNVAGRISRWFVTFVEDTVGGRTINVSNVEWISGAPPFNTSPSVSNHCTFTQYGTGPIFGEFNGASFGITHNISVLTAFGARVGAITAQGLIPPSSIDGTGATNVTAALQAWIDAQPDGASALAPTTFNFTGKIYRCDQQMHLISRNNLTMIGGTIQTDDPTGDGSTLGSPSGAARTRSHWLFRDSTNIIVDGMTVRGPNPGGYVAALEAQHAFAIEASTNVEIRYCNISHVYGDWVYQTINSATGVWCDAVHVHHNTCDYNGRQGFDIAAGRNSIFQYNTCDHMARAFVDLEPNGAGFGAYNVLIDSNTVGVHGLTFVAAGGLGPVDNITISNNTCIGSNLWVIVLGSGGSRANWVINNNTSDISLNSSGGVVMELEMMTNVTVTNNTQDVTGAWPMALAYVNQCVGVVCQGNTINGATTVLHDTSRYVRNCGNRLTGSGAFNVPIACVTDFGTPKQYAPALTGWYEAYNDAAVYGDLAAVDQMTDYSGNNRHLVAAGSARPTMRYNISGKQMKGYHFNSLSNVAGNTITMSQFLSASAYTVFIVFEATSFGTGVDDGIWTDSNSNGLYLASGGAGAYIYNVDAGGGDAVTSPITLGKRTLLMMRHEGGNLYMSKDGGTESSVPSGNTTTLAGLLRVGANYLGNEYFSGLIHEIEFYNVALAAPQIADRNNRLMIDWKVAFYYGAADTFTRPDGPIGTSEGGGKLWVNGPRTAWYVVGGKAMLVTADNLGGANMAYIDCGLSDCTPAVDFDVASGGGALLFRFQDYSNYNFLFAGGGELWLYKVVGSNNIQLRHTTGLASAGPRQLKVVMSDSTVQSYYDGALIWTDTLTNCQGSVNNGLFTFGTTAPACTWDNFLVTA